MNTSTLLTTLERWCEAGWLRRLDLALARFVAQTDPHAPPSALLATALVAHLEGQGHTGLPLEGLDALCASENGPPTSWAWPAAAAPALREALRAVWPLGDGARRAAWSGLVAIEIDLSAAAPAIDGGAHWTTFRLLVDVGMSRRRVVHGGGRSAPATNRPAAAVGNPCSVRRCWPTKFLTRHTRCADVSFRLPCPRGDCPERWPLDGPHETRSPRGAGRPRRATGCSAKVCSQERRSVSDPPGLPTRQVIPQLAGVCP